MGVVAKLGGVLPAAVELGIGPSLMARFVEGRVPVPDSILLQAVDIVLDENPAGDSQPFDRNRR
jgi:hypothetical protein